MIKKSLYVVLLCLSVVFFIGCGGGGSGDSSSSEFIGTSGGTVVSSDGNVTLNVPEGALNDNTTITIQESTVAGDVGAIGQSYDFNPDGTQFNIPAHVKITYDPSSLPTGINEADLAIAYFTVNGWEIVDSSVVNQADHSIEADLPHFSTVGLSKKNSYPQTLVKETDFDGHLASSFRVPIGDDGTTDYGNDSSLLSISPDSKKITFNENKPNNGWYVATTFNEAYSLGQHPGEDWNLSSGGSTDEGKPVHAISNGIVLFDGWKWGNTIILGHKLASGEIVASFYGHLQSKPNLSVGALINKGDIVGNIGNTGTKPFHLHFEIAKGIGEDGINYMLKKNNSNEIVFGNESTYTTGGQKYYGAFWLWPGTNSTLVDNNWYAPSDLSRNMPTPSPSFSTLSSPSLLGPS